MFAYLSTIACLNINTQFSLRIAAKSLVASKLATLPSILIMVAGSIIRFAARVPISVAFGYQASTQSTIGYELVRITAAPGATITLNMLRKIAHVPRYVQDSHKAFGT